MTDESLPSLFYMLHKQSLKLSKQNS